MENSKKIISLSSRFFSVIYNKIYYTISSISIAVIISIITTMEINLKQNILYSAALAIYGIEMFILYITSKNIRKRNGTLHIEELNTWYKIKKTSIMFIWTIIIMIVINIVNVMISLA